MREKQGIQQVGIGKQRAAFMSRAAKRFDGLSRWMMVRVPAMPSDRVSSIVDRQRHAKARAGFFGKSVAARALGVAREWRTGRYRRFGSGWRSALSDLLGLD